MSTHSASSGSHAIGPSNGTLTVHTTRAGMATRAGHDLVIEATSWNATLTIDEAEPERSRLELTVDATSFQVREGSGGVKPLSDSDRADILKNMTGKVLDTSRHSEIKFVSDTVRMTEEGSMTAAGDLTLAGVTEPVHVTLDVACSDAGERTLSASVSLLQSRFGIKPFSAMMGTLKVADEVTIHAEGRLSD